MEGGDEHAFQTEIHGLDLSVRQLHPELCWAACLEIAHEAYGVLDCDKWSLAEELHGGPARPGESAHANWWQLARFGKRNRILRDGTEVSVSVVVHSEPVVRAKGKKGLLSNYLNGVLRPRLHRGEPVMLAVSGEGDLGHVYLVIGARHGFDPNGSSAFGVVEVKLFDPHMGLQRWHRLDNLPGTAVFAAYLRVEARNAVSHTR